MCELLSSTTLFVCELLYALHSQVNLGIYIRLSDVSMVCVRCLHKHKWTVWIDVDM